MASRLPAVIAHPLRVLGEQLGTLAERAMRRRHLHRLRRAGHLQPGQGLEKLSRGPFDARDGNQVEVLVDGKAAFASMAAAIRGAKRTVKISSWTANPTFQLDADDPTSAMNRLLAEATDRGVTSRVLLWRGAPVSVIRPSKADAAQAAAGFNAIDGVRCVLDSREYLLDCHHEKLIIVDDEIAFSGGLDPTDLVSNRWDSPAHPPRVGDGWHDAAVRVTGPVVADVAHHFAQRWTEVAGEVLDVSPTPAPTGGVSARLVRTIPEKVYRFAPRGDFGVLAAYLDALRSAQRLIYLENQFLWAVEVVDVLVDKLRHPPHEDFRLVIVLPERAHTGQDATLGQLSRLLAADVDQRLLAMAVQSESAGHLVYVHAKIGTVDDHWLTVGSANLNSHSLFNDTEVNLVFESTELARRTREDLWQEHVGHSAEGVEPVKFIDDVLRPLATEQSRRRQLGQPPTGRLRLLAGASRRTDLLLGPISSLIVDA